MSDDAPLEFRAAKSGLSIADWLAGRTRRDAVIYAGATALLTFCGVFALAATYIFFFLVMWGLLCGVIPRSLLHLPVIGGIVGLFVLQRRFDGDDVEPVKVDAGPRGDVTLRLSRLTGSSWLMYLDKPAGDLNPVIRFVTNALFLAPRLFRVSWRMWSMVRRMRTMDTSSVAAALDALMQAGGRIAIGDLIQDFPNHDPQRLIESMTAVDGVILLASDPPGLTLSPAFVEDFDAWKAEIRRKRRARNA
ncbi:MAG: hypothetical protein M3552_14700 [Planctomycetota bacterium]|nr:hypothetical protein [Planctomycetaceae bacterium]MDQ3331879.1 hypothetical protein [Planctomycetota bacterium]